jgi:hypothetical protein
MRDAAWLGSCICIFEAEYAFRVSGVLTVSTEHPLLPLANCDLGRCISTYVEEWAISNDMQELFVRDADLIAEGVDMVEGHRCAMASTRVTNGAAHSQ